MDDDKLLWGLIGSSALLFMASKVVHHLTIDVACTNPTNRVVTLEKGWNMISYFCDKEIPPEVVFASILEDMVVVTGWHDGDDVAYFPSPGTIPSTLENLRPGYGYGINMEKPRQLDYDAVCVRG